MDYLMIGLVAFFASGLTLYSGFGLGTVLLPTFAIFFPVPIAVAATGTVHLLNNIFKGGLLHRKADWRTVAFFGLPAVPAAIMGARLLVELGNSPQLFAWDLFGRAYGPTAAGVTIGTLMILFAALELQPWFQRLAAPPRSLPLGGLITGFFGGLTGQQGALRAMFLMKSGLDPARYVATGALIAIIIDVSRLPTYASGLRNAHQGLGGHGWSLVAVGTLCAFAGAILGVRYLRRATSDVVRSIVATAMFFVGTAVLTGVLGS